MFSTSQTKVSEGLYLNVWLNGGFLVSFRTGAAEVESFHDFGINRHDLMIDDVSTAYIAHLQVR